MDHPMNINQTSLVPNAKYKYEGSSGAASSEELYMYCMCVWERETVWREEEGLHRQTHALL